jgi:Family of unknown function (DUF6504)
MTHVYYHPITVTLAGGIPTSLHWRGIIYRVLEVNEPWHLMDRWWEPSGASGNSDTSAAPLGGQHRSDRTYYRLRCASAHEDLTCEIYFEAVGGVWVLERVYD